MVPPKAMSVAKRVAEEFGCRLGQEVGYAIRFEDHSSSISIISVSIIIIISISNIISMGIISISIIIIISILSRLRHPTRGPDRPRDPD